MTNKKYIITSFTILLITQVYLQSPAQHVSLNGTWHFKTDLYKQGEKDKWFLPQTNTSGWDEMAVPGNWDLENEYAAYVGKVWYKKAFKTEEAWKGRRIRLYFESVYNDAQVWLNGKKMTENHLGFLPFWVDIQDDLNWDGENVLVVQADNTFKRGAIWNWGGIRRSVWLEITPMVRLEQQHITAIPDLQKGTAEINIRLKISNADEKDNQVGYQYVLLKDGKEVWQSKTKEIILIPAKGEKLHEINFNLKKQDVALWHFNQPHLYTGKLRLTIDNQPVHELKDRFGIRKIEIDGYQFKLNGESIRTVGFNLVPEDRTTGNTLPLWRIKEDVDLMKSLGANMARTSHLPLPKDFLDYLDEKGIMTFEEVSLWGKDEMVDPEHPMPKEWLERMITLKYNHPSIIGWSIGNEIGFLNANPKVMEYVATASEHAKQLDPHRLAVNVSHSAQAQEKDPVKYSDLILYNRYGNWGKDAVKVNELHPGKPIFMAEYGKELNNENPNESLVDAKSMLDKMRGKIFLIGASLWTFNDYRSFWQAGPTWTTPPSQNRTWGIVNTFRKKKKSFYAFKKEYAPVQSLSIKKTASRRAEVSIEPRGELDIPAYSMNGYRLVWAAFSKKDQLIDGSFTNLPEILPGDNTKSQEINWNTEEVARLEIHLLDPQDYSVLDTIVHFTPPPLPEILSVHSATTSIRVIFKPVKNATAYYLRYGKKGETLKKSALTINDFIEVKGLERFTGYDFEVVAINAAGESLPSPKITTKTDEDELPPIIWATVPSNEAFFIGYTVDRQDYLYEIAYGTQTGQYTDTLVLRNVGVCKIPNLENGKTYYYKMRLRKQWGFASEWSHEISVMPDGDKPRGSISIKGVLKEGKDYLLLFEPIPKASGYILETTSGKKINIHHAQSGFYTLKGIAPEEIENLTLRLK
ncbi:MAG: glycoside hydrolase family 2 TIM barrel-domain containing protein [Bacteroidota bacterium]